MAHTAQVELMVGSTWTDLTAAGDVYVEDGITITRGRTAEGGDVDPGTCRLTLNNTGGKYSPRKPTSPYYGLIGRNTPLRVSVRAGAQALLLPGAVGDHASTPDATALDILGDIDVRVDAALSNWVGHADLSGTTEIIGKYSATNGLKSWILTTREERIYFEWSADGSTVIGATSTMPIAVGAAQRLAIRVTLDVNNGLGGWTATFYTAPSGTSGPWTQLGDPVTGTGVTSIFNSTTAVQVGDASTVGFSRATGVCYAAEIRNGIGGTVVAAPNFAGQAIGTTSFTDSAGRTWTMNGGTAISNKRIRFVGEVSEWPPRWHSSGGDQRVTIQASGILRRLNQGSAPLDSTLRRRIPSTGPLAYWPLEEQQDATQAYSPIAGVRPLRVSGVDWASDDSLAGSSALPAVRAGGVLSGLVPAPPAPTGTIYMEFIYRIDTAPATERTVLRMGTNGTVNLFTFLYQAGQVRILAEDADGNTVFSFPGGVGTDVYGAWTRQIFFLQQNGSNVDWSLRFVPIGGSGGQFTGSYAGTVGRQTSVSSPPGWHADLAGMRLGHISSYSAVSLTAYNSADTGFLGETAGNRFLRLCVEEGVPYAVYGTKGQQTALGPQRPASLLDTLGAAATADGGTLYEARDQAALRYRDRIGQYNQAPTLALTYGQPGFGPPFEPIDDDRFVRNDRTVQRDGGSSARATLDVGTLSTQAPPNGVGLYDDSVTLSLATDEQCGDQASWRLWLGTWDEARFPSVHVSLTKAAAAGLIDPATAVEIRDRITISNLPDSLPPDTIQLFAEGYTETITPTTWDITYVCSPAGPFDVGVRDDAVRGRRDTDGSTLVSAVSDTATSLSVATPSGILWTPEPADAPFDVEVAGEVMTVLAVGTILNAAVWDFESGVTGWGPNGSGALTSSTVRAKHGTGSALLTTNGGATPRFESSPRLAITTGQQYRVSGWVYAGAAVPSTISVGINWYDAGNAFLSGTMNAATPTVGDWRLYDAVFTAPASATQAGVVLSVTGTPASGIQVWADLMSLIPVSSYSSSPQPMTVVRSVNGVVKTQSAGARLSLARPAVRAL